MCPAESSITRSAPSVDAALELLRVALRRKRHESTAIASVSVIISDGAHVGRGCFALGYMKEGDADRDGVRENRDHEQPQRAQRRDEREERDGEARLVDDRRVARRLTADSWRKTASPSISSVYRRGGSSWPRRRSTAWSR